MNVGEGNICDFISEFKTNFNETKALVKSSEKKMKQTKESIIKHVKPLNYSPNPATLLSAM